MSTPNLAAHYVANEGPENHNNRLSIEALQTGKRDDGSPMTVEAHKRFISWHRSCVSDYGVRYCNRPVLAAFHQGLLEAHIAALAALQKSQ